ncbi:MAG: T9SS type A sorting domain-containing protein [Paludibacter sp.]
MKFLLVGGFSLLANSFMAQSTVVNDSIGKTIATSISRVSASTLAAPWTKEIALQYNMAILAKLYKNGVLFQPTGVLLGIFKDNKCWGYAGIGTSPVGPLMNVTMGYNTATASGFTYKVYDPASGGQIYEVVETVNFKSNTPVGLINAPISLNVKFAIAATSSDVIKGSVSGITGSFTSGQAISLTATPTTGNSFVNWTNGGTIMSTDAVYAFTASENRNLIANFVANYNVTATPSDVLKGSVTGGGYIVPGQAVSLTATPTSGNRFIKWTVAGVTVSTSATYNFTPNANKTLVANFDVISSNQVTVTNATSSDITTNSDVTINNGGTLSIDVAKEVYSLSVATGAKIDIKAPLTVNTDVILAPGAKIDLTQPLTVVGDVTFKADQNNSFSANIASAMTVTGTVRYVKTMNDDQWYFMSFPCNVTISEISQVGGAGLGVLGTDWFINYYDGASRISNLGATSNWKNVTVVTANHTNTLTLEANKGYIFGLKTGVGTKDLAFILDKALVAASESAVRTIPVVAYGNGASVATNHKGWNLVGQPYLSRFKGANANGLTLMSFPTGKGKTYSQNTKESFSSIDPFSAYFVQADATLETNGIAFALLGRQLTSSAVETNQTDRVQLNFTSATGTDNTNLILSNDQSVEYTIGQDLEKMLGLGTSQPQVYTNLNGINYAFNSLPINNVSNLAVGFYTQTAGSNVISVDASQATELSQLLLTDNTNSTTTDLLTSNYSFVAEAGVNNTRFSITAKRITTDNSIESTTDSPIIRTAGHLLTISNMQQAATVRVFDAMGRLVFNKQMSAGSIELNLTIAGVYSVQLQTVEKNWTVKTIIK